MKKLILLITALLFVKSGALAYDFTKKEVAPIGYDLTLSSEFKSAVNQQDPTLLASLKSQSKFRFIIYFAIENIIREKGINILPYQCFGEKASYDEFGFPKIAVMKAVKTNAAHFYFKIEQTLTILQVHPNGNATVGIKTTLTPYKSPSVIPMDKVEVEDSYEVQISDGLLNGFRNSDEEILPTSLLSAIRLSAERLAIQLTQK